MKELSTSLYFKDEKSDKIYQASLEKSGQLFVVNFAYGKRGGNLKTGTKTAKPVAYDAAKKIYDKLVKSKTDKGYNADVSNGQKAKVAEKSKPVKKTTTKSKDAVQRSESVWIKDFGFQALLKKNGCWSV